MWNLALVDPDNRRPVDYATRQRLLDEVAMSAEDPDPARRAAYLDQLVRAPEDGRIKLHFIRCALHVRREHPDLFSESAYRPLKVRGAARDNVVAYARTAGPYAMVVLVPRLTRSLPSGARGVPAGEEVWRDTKLLLPEELQGRQWTCGLTRAAIRENSGGSIAVADAARVLPAALLVSRSE
jgi:(1->4)-alpha-D-glucan 1-alpha-D-glucosylmutase